MNPSNRRRATLAGIVLILWLAAAGWKSLGRPALSGSLPGWLRLLSNSLPSFVGGLTVPLGFLAAHPHPSPAVVPRVCAWSVALLILAEVVELAFRSSHFDWNDIALSLVGVAMAGSVAWAVLRSARTSS
jgi:hypothetical protein